MFWSQELVFQASLRPINAFGHTTSKYHQYSQTNVFFILFFFSVGYLSLYSLIKNHYTNAIKLLFKVLWNPYLYIRSNVALLDRLIIIFLYVYISLTHHYTFSISNIKLLSLTCSEWIETLMASSDKLQTSKYLNT